LGNFLAKHGDRSTFLEISFRREAALASLSALRSAPPSWLLMFGSRSAELPTMAGWHLLGLSRGRLSNKRRP
jgi:hypothetical protein